MADWRRIKSDLSISRHVALAMSAGIIPLPAIDFAVVTGVQVDLVYRLCRIYDVPFAREAASGAVTALVGASVPGLSAMAASGVKAVPGVGTLAGILAAPGLAAASTYAVGRVFRRHLEAGGTLLTFDAQKMKAHFEQSMRERRTTPTDDGSGAA